MKTWIPLLGAAALAGCPTNLTIGRGRIELRDGSATGALLTAELNFGEVLLGGKTRRGIALVNAGDGALAIVRDVGLSAPPSFTLDGPLTGCGGAPLADPRSLRPGECALVSIAYAPVSPGTERATLSVYTDDPDKLVAQASFRAAGTAQGSGVEVCVAPGTGDDFGKSLSVCLTGVNPLAMDFGPVKINAEAQRRIRLTNRGAAAVSVSRAEASPAAFVAANTIVGPLAPGASATLAVAFRPQTAGAVTGTLSLATSDPALPALSVPLKGEGQTGPTGAVQVCIASGPGDDTGKSLSNCSSPSLKQLVMDFAGVSVGSTRIRRGLLRNTGLGPLALRRVEATGGATEFAVVAAGIPTTLNPGDTFTFTVVFTPRNDGSFGTAVTVGTDDPVGGPVTLDLVAQGLAGRVCQTAAITGGLDFGQIPVGNSGTLGLSVANCGNASLTLSSHAINRTDFSAAAGTTPRTLAAGASTILSITFSPQAISSVSGTLDLLADSPLTPKVSVPLKGQGVQPPTCKLTSSASSFDFGVVVVGSRGTRSLTLQNIGAQTCTLSSIAPDAAGSAARFLVVSGPPTPAALASGGSATVTVGYEPQDGNPPDTGSLDVMVNDPTLPNGRLAVSVTGTPATVSGCGVRIVPAAGAGGRVLDFGTRMVGSTGTLTATVTNTGASACSIGSLTWATTADRVVFDMASSQGLPATLATQQSLVLTATFRPTAPATWAAGANTVTFSTGDSAPSECGTLTAGCKQIGLSGAAVPSTTVVTVPDAIDFGNVATGCRSVAQIVLLWNNSTTSVTLGTAAVQNSAFSLTQQPAANTVLQPGNSAEYRLRFAPTASGAVTGMLTIAHNGQGGVSATTLRGTGGAGAAQTDTWVQPPVGHADVLWIVDDSCSMWNYQTNLGSVASAFVNAATTAGADFQTGVITTDMDSAYTAPTGSGWPGTTITPGALWGTPKIIKPSTPNNVSVLQNSMRPGTNGTGWEKGLAAMRAALTPPIATDLARNGGFLRSSARLAVVVVSDENDQSAAGEYGLLLWRLKNMRAKTEWVRYYAIMATAAGCGTSVGTAYSVMANGMGGLIFSICSISSQIGTDIANDLFVLSREFVLSRPRDAGASITVRVFNGTAWSTRTDFNFDSAANSIVFWAGAAPAAGHMVEASYSAVCQP